MLFKKPEIIVTSISQHILDSAKIAYSCRRVPFNSSMTLLSGDITPRSGHLVLAQVDVIGQHRGLESKNGRRANLFPGDHIIVCYGNRYAPDQFEAEVPEDLSPCNLVAAGGMASKVISQHASMNNATTISPMGIIGDDKGQPINLSDWALTDHQQHSHKPPVFAVLGTSMNAGKTTTAACLVRGLNQAGLKVGAAKITGTGSPKDVSLMADSGAFPVFDFTDAGHPSTYHLSPKQVEIILSTLTSHLAAAQVDAIVLEIADGLFQRETEALCLSRRFAETVDGVFFAAGDAMGAAFGAEWLIKKKLPLVGLSGLFTTSPLAIREAKQYMDLPVFTSQDLCSAEIADTLGLVDTLDLMDDMRQMA